MQQKVSISEIDNWRSADNVQFELNDWPHLQVFKGSISSLLAFPTEHNVAAEYKASIPVGDFPEFRFYIRRYHKPKQHYRKVEDFEFKFEIGNFDDNDVFVPADTWYVPIEKPKDFQLVNIDVSHLKGQSFQGIRLTKLRVGEQRIHISDMILSQDNLVTDVYQELLANFHHKIQYLLGELGQDIANGAAGFRLPDTMNVTRHSVIEIREGDKIERHQIAGEVIDAEVTFTKEFDGEVLVNDFSSAAQVFLTVPCIISNKFAAYAEPSIYLHGILPDYRGDGELTNDTQYFYDSFKADKCRRVSGDRDLTLPIKIIVVTEKPEIMNAVNQEIFRLLGDYFVLQNNGLYYDVIYKGSQFEEGNLEGDSDRTLHEIEVRGTMVTGKEKMYVRFPFETKVSVAVRSKYGIEIGND